MAILNCWEFKKCGREPGGEKVDELGVCPVALEDKYNKLNRGKNSGRACWLVAGSLCEIKFRGKRGKKQWECSQCKVFQIVREEEGDNFVYHIG
jgi:hypothetical protein